MSSNLVGSRYEFHLTHEGAAERKRAASYHAVYAEDLAEAPADELVGYVHSIEVGSTVDGPGIRFVLFLTGCPMRCQYCHNPDTWHKHNGAKYPLSRIMYQIGKYTEVLRISGGGLTISGGEPAMQPKLVSAIMREAKALGMHTCLDTSGRLGTNLSDADLANIDLHLLDIKSGDPETYERVTGHPLQPTLDYARRLTDLGRPLWVRFVLAPGLTDAEENVARVAEICAGLPTLERVEVLRFHQMGKEKYRKLGIPYPLAETEPPSPELAERVRGQFRARGLTVY
ncbi:pyruvate formate-lyase-activating protein [Amaricoccus sp.]|uniref:pyruvate formate-lyase-activating protein n=1 Tax=Amaricoccus sp. TaxID=1872485 RepID=UPI001B676CBC|nr:pyruvate formate-lyase-activating protein [Amaricoccus sp.]MBP7002157.1 pyruvate formate lyase-activating protein [Amaricoccus sp.]